MPSFGPGFPTSSASGVKFGSSSGYKYHANYINFEEDALLPDSYQLYREIRSTNSIYVREFDRFSRLTFYFIVWMEAVPVATNWLGKCWRQGLNTSSRADGMPSAIRMA